MSAGGRLSRGVGMSHAWDHSGRPRRGPTAPTCGNPSAQLNQSSSADTSPSHLSFHSTTMNYYHIQQNLSRGPKNRRRRRLMDGRTAGPPTGRAGQSSKAVGRPPLSLAPPTSHDMRASRAARQVSERLASFVGTALGLVIHSFLSPCRWFARLQIPGGSVWPLSSRSSAALALPVRAAAAAGR